MPELRPCIFRCRGSKRVGLFHCWAVSNGNDIYYTKKGETVALVENKNGAILEINSNNIYFIDTDKQMIKFNDYFQGGNNA